MRAESGEASDRRILRSALVLTGLVAACGVVTRWQLLDTGMAEPSGTNIFFRLYALHELPHLLLLGMFVAFTTLLFVRSNTDTNDGARLAVAAPSARQVGLIALAMVLAGLVINHLVMHRLLFAMDEYSADFQARIFARGEYAPVVQWPWRSLATAMTPIFVHFHEDTGRWASVYLPVYSLLKAPFVRAGLEALLNPLLSAGSIVALAGVTRWLWPDEGLRPWVAIALLATSSQVVVTSGTGYSMPAHLFLNLVWLWLYLRGDARSWAAALLVGVAAMGLHNPFPHTLFVAPFMVRLLRERRWGRLSAAAIVYVAGAALWLSWLRFADPVTSGAKSGLFTLFERPDLATLVLHGMNVSLLFTWNAPVLGLLVLVAVSMPRRLDARLVDLALGVLATLLFFMLYPSSQGHGWGYRYAYPVLGNLCLLAAAGVPTVFAVLGCVRTRLWLVAGFVLALAVQIPIRLRETEQFVRPFAVANSYIRRRPAKIVIVQGDSIWYRRDLIRNDPFLAYPIVVNGPKLSRGLIDQLERIFPGAVIELSADDLKRLGMLVSNRLPPGGRGN
jgi:hypothetical protein